MREFVLFHKIGASYVHFFGKKIIENIVFLHFSVPSTEKRIEEKARDKQNQELGHTLAAGPGGKDRLLKGGKGEQ